MGRHDKFKPYMVDRVGLLNKFGLNDSKILLFFAGNPSKRKGADLLPRIMKQLGDNFTLLTTSGLRKDIHNVDKNIVSLGRLTESEIVDIYNLCDIFLAPTRLEGFGLTIAEAMACAKPIVATDCSAIPELVINEKGGFLCKIDDVNDFCNKITYLSENRGVAQKMGGYNRARVEEFFSLDTMGQNYLDLYMKLL